MTKEIRIITGTTAVGKTAFALDWAEKNGAEILSCDSTNVYRGMDIGTAKPTAEERSRVPHHCLDLVAPNEKFSVSDYVACARAALDEIFSKGAKALVSGGSGFYLKAFFAPVTDALEIPQAARERVAEILSRGNAFSEETLREMNDGGRAAPADFDWKNPRRVAKGLERCIASGKTLAALKADFEARECAFAAFPKRAILLVREKESLNRRIASRVKKMLAAGLVDEVRGLLAAGMLPPNTPAGNAIGYRETVAWLASGESGGLPALAETLELSTRRLAAKQRKWFRTQIPIDEELILKD